ERKRGRVGLSKRGALRCGKGPTPTLPEDGEGEGRFFPSPSSRRVAERKRGRVGLSKRGALSRGKRPHPDPPRRRGGRRRGFPSPSSGRGAERKRGGGGWGGRAAERKGGRVGFSKRGARRRGKGPTPTLPEDGEGEGRFFPPRLRGGWPSASEAGWGSANAVRGAVGKAPPRPSPKTGR